MCGGYFVGVAGAIGCGRRVCGRAGGGREGGAGEVVGAAAGGGVSDCSLFSLRCSRTCLWSATVCARKKTNVGCGIPTSVFASLSLGLEVSDVFCCGTDVDFGEELTKKRGGFLVAAAPRSDSRNKKTRESRCIQRDSSPVET